MLLLFCPLDDDIDVNQLHDEELELYFNKLMPPAMQRGHVEGQEISVVSSFAGCLQKLTFFLFYITLCSCCRSYLPVHLSPSLPNQKGTDTISMMTMTKYGLIVIKLNQN